MLLMVSLSFLVIPVRLTTIEIQAEAATKVYTEWLHKAGVELFHGVRVIPQHNEWGEPGVTVHVPSGIPKGQPLARIPHSAVLSTLRWRKTAEGEEMISTLRRAAKGHPFVTADSSFNHFMLSVAVSLEGGSRWGGLTHVIGQGNQPLWWQKEHIDLTQGTLLHRATKESNDELETSTDIMRDVLRGARHSCQGLQKARTAALEHAFQWEGDLVLVPVVHLAKRRLAVRGLTPAFETDTHGLVWLSAGSEGVESGNGQIIRETIRMDQLQLLWHFGMVVPGNPSNIVHKVFRGRSSLLRHVEANRGGVGSPWMRKYQRGLETIGDQHKLTATGSPVSYVMAIRLLMCEMKELDCSHLFSRAVADSGKQELSPSDEAQVWTAAALGLRSHLQRLQGGTAAEDRALAQRPGLHKHYVLAVLYRAAEKEILEAQVRHCEGQAAAKAAISNEAQ